MTTKDMPRVSIGRYLSLGGMANGLRMLGDDIDRFYNISFKMGPLTFLEFLSLQIGRPLFHGRLVLPDRHVKENCVVVFIGDKPELFMDIELPESRL